MKKVLVFDFDGTLCHSFGLVNDSVVTATKKFIKRELTREELIKAYGPSEDGIIKRLVEEKDWKHAFSAYLEFYNEHHNEYFTDFIPGIRDLLEELKSKGYTVYLLTGRSRESLMISLTKLDAFKYFDDYYCGSLEGAVKNQLLLQLMKEHNLKASELLYFGDTLGDVEQCREVGVEVVSVLYDNDYCKKEILDLNKDFVCENVANLKDFIF